MFYWFKLFVYLFIYLLKLLNYLLEENTISQQFLNNQLKQSFLFFLRLLVKLSVHNIYSAVSQQAEKAGCLR